MHRQPEHVIQFLYSELGTQGSVDGAQRLVMKGRYTQKQIENVLRKYIGKSHESCCRWVMLSGTVEYVTCKICKSPDTLLGKENRLYFMTCESCGSRKSAFLWMTALIIDRPLRLRDQGGLPSTDREESQGGVGFRMSYLMYIMHMISHLPGICLTA